MRTAVIIEIPAAAVDQLPMELLEAAYRASATVPVMLVVPRIVRPIVDRAFDSIVSTVGLEVGGVRYIARHDVDRIRTVLFDCAWSVVVTSEFRTLCESMNVSVLTERTALDALRGRSRPASAVALPTSVPRSGQALAS